jgi:hypothetical protein
MSHRFANFIFVLTVLAGVSLASSAQARTVPHYEICQGDGGGLYILTTDLGVCLEAFTQAHVKHNKVSTLDPDIDGSFKNY